MPRIMKIAAKHKLPVVEDGCQSLLGEIDGKRIGTFGAAAAFSMHPLKGINVWGDAGVIVTNDDEMDRKLRLLRNHGLKNRDEMEILGYNTRLDSVQAVVGKYIVKQTRDIVEKRAKNAAYYDAGLKGIKGARIPPRNPRVKNVYLLYVLLVERRDDLVKYCVERGIEAKVHYPIPLYQQKALSHYGYKAGAFPVTDRHAKECITFPVDQHLSRAEMDYVIETIRNFYAGKA
jgi:dTDP-4-amino-4,6-dideoxygalactose transaminase